MAAMVDISKRFRVVNASDGRLMLISDRGGWQEALIVGNPYVEHIEVQMNPIRMDYIGGGGCDWIDGRPDSTVVIRGSEVEIASGENLIELYDSTTSKTVLELFEMINAKLKKRQY